MVIRSRTAEVWCKMPGGPGEPKPCCVNSVTGLFEGVLVGGAFAAVDGLDGRLLLARRGWDGSRARLFGEDELLNSFEEVFGFFFRLFGFGFATRRRGVVRAFLECRAFRRIRVKGSN